MNPTYLVFLLAFLPFLVLFFLESEQRMLFIRRHILSKKKGGRTHTMFELAKEFIGKDCLIYTYNTQISGVIREVTENALLIDNGKESEIVNLDFVVRIREYPKTKSGKKKSVITD